ncbi:tetratricopeptide repeat protein [Streptomyces sp. NPDC101165]|uniref:tetratricopeptide repeat protein n=1 Tax=Streptomyces sp. NPDC101165 TaxID=3366119 RepID=UPI0037FB5A38
MSRARTGISLLRPRASGRSWTWIPPTNTPGTTSASSLSPTTERPTRALYDHALDVDPDFESALYNKAILLESSDTDQAIAIYRRIVSADPKASTAYLHLGQALAKKGRDGEADDAFGRAVRTDRSIQQLVPEQFRDSARATPTATQTGTGR